MKKIVSIMVLTCVVMGGAFAQQKPAAPGTKASVSLAGTTWKATVQQGGKSVTLTLSFTASTVKYTQSNPPQTINGTYKFNGKSGTITSNGKNDSFAVGKNGNKLTLARVTFTKQ